MLDYDFLDFDDAVRDWKSLKAMIVIHINIRSFAPFGLGLR